MKLSTLGLGALSFSLPIAVGAGQIPIPQDVPWPAALLVAALGPACVGFLGMLGKSIVLVISAYFKKQSEFKKQRAKEMLADNDKSNDAEAKKLLLQAEAERAAAEQAEKIALNDKRGE
jgi:hypothetical protein